MSNKSKLDDLLKYTGKNNRIHPRSDKWFELYYNILTKPESQKSELTDDGFIVKTVSYGNNRPEIPPVRFTGPYLIRRMIFEQHIKHAFKIDKLNEADKFLRNLKDNEWFTDNGVNFSSI